MSMPPNNSCRLREACIIGDTFPASNHVREILTCLGKPPVAEEKKNNRAGGEVGEGGPVGRGAFDQNAAVTSDQWRKGIETDVEAIAFRHYRFGIDDRRQVHPGHQKKRDALSDVAQENSERRY